MGSVLSPEEEADIQHELDAILEEQVYHLCPFPT